MGRTADDGLVYACITHVTPWLAFPDYVTTIHLGEAQGEGRLNLRDLAPEWEPYHPVLGGTAGSFALKNYLRTQRPDATRVGLCQYRKFVSPRRISGVQDRKYRAMDVVPTNMIDGPQFAEMLWPQEAPFVVSGPRRFTRLPWYRRGYLKEYARDHHVEDLLRFTAEAVEQQVLRSDEVLAFFREDVIVPGGVELGVYPADFWLECIEGIERTVRACVARYPVPREGVQARAWSFCAERLGSFLLLKHFRAEAATGFVARHVEPANRAIWKRRFAGQLNLIVEGGEHKGYTAGA